MNNLPLSLIFHSHYPQMADAGRHSPDSSSSLSFLDEENTVARPPPSHSGTREAFDPLFMSSKVKIPRSIEKLFKGVESVGFMYEIVETDYIEAVDMKNGELVFKVYTSRYETFPFDGDEAGLIFVTDRESFKTRHKAEQKKRYKESIAKAQKFVEDSAPKDFRKKYLDYQIRTGANFVFIDTPEHLHAHMRSLINMKQSEEKYVPKTKKFNEGDKGAFLKSVLESISGVSSTLSGAIVEVYPSMGALSDGVRNEALFTSVRETGQRGMNEGVYAKILKAFTSEDPDEKL